MSAVTGGADLLAALARRWRRRRDVAATIVALGVGLATVALASRYLTAGGVLAAGLAAALAAGLLARLRWRGIGSDTVARHLNRTVPAVEESSELLLRPPGSLNAAERLQRARVESAVQPLLVAMPSLPHRPLRRAALAAPMLLAAAIALGLATRGVGDTGSARGTPRGDDAAIAAGPAVPPRVAAVEIVVQPPAYTRLPERRQSSWELEVPEGSLVIWRVRADRAARVLLETAAGDTVPLAASGGSVHEGRLRVERSTLYRVVAAGPAGVGPPTRTDFHRLTVSRDAPPLVTVVRPEEPRTLLPQGAPRRAELHALATDDYGLTDVAILATVTSGRGEGVSFREVTLPFDRSEARGRGGGRDLRKAFDLAAMGLGPGDELYFQVVARDNRSPVPNEARSETFFVVLEDTSAVPQGDWTGLAVERVPEYFRSQRQIIIDTERLLAERGGLPRAAFRDRSDAIGFDQHLLRLRYGALVGDETGEEGPEDAGNEPPMHDHDSEENATLLAAEVKATLRAALAQMWEAERHLRTYDPSAALPYEYRALELLKRVQQAARAYVLRSGYEPPPLEVQRLRLTGRRDGIADRTAERDPPAGPDSGREAIRRALDAVRSALRGEGAAGSLPPLLEAAGRALAPRAVEEPGPLLDLLGDLRVLSDTLARGAGCEPCLRRVAAGLWRALPTPAPAPDARSAGAAPLARWYFDLLQGAR